MSNISAATCRVILAFKVLQLCIMWCLQLRCCVVGYESRSYFRGRSLYSASDSGLLGPVRTTLSHHRCNFSFLFFFNSWTNVLFYIDFIDCSTFQNLHFLLLIKQRGWTSTFTLHSTLTEVSLLNMKTLRRKKKGVCEREPTPLGDLKQCFQKGEKLQIQLAQQFGFNCIHGLL